MHDLIQSERYHADNDLYFAKWGIDTAFMYVVKYGLAVRLHCKLSFYYNNYSANYAGYEAASLRPRYVGY